MNIYLNEDEQVELLKQWCKKYGKIILVILILGVSTMLSYQYWQNRQLTRSVQASTIYQNLLDEIDREDWQRQARQANYLKQQYSNTIYASMASLFLAKQAVMNQDFVLANRELKSAVAHTKPKILKDLIQLRRARVLVELEQYAKALHVLERVQLPALKPAVENIRGDILLQRGDIAAAKAAYQAAQSMAQLEEWLNLKLTAVLP